MSGDRGPLAPSPGKAAAWLAEQKGLGSCSQPATLPNTRDRAGSRGKLLQEGRGSEGKGLHGSTARTLVQAPGPTSRARGTCQAAVEVAGLRAWPAEKVQGIRPRCLEGVTFPPAWRAS